MEKLSIQNEMAQLDSKSRDFYDSLTDEERKKFSNFLMIRWGSAVQGSSDLQEYYLFACNERLNKHFFDLSKHPKLQWLLATTISPGVDAFREAKIPFPPRHQWIAPKKKDKGNNEVKKTLMELLPSAKMSDIDALSKIITKAELREMIKDLGNDK